MLIRQARNLGGSLRRGSLTGVLTGGSLCRAGSLTSGTLTGGTLLRHGRLIQLIQ